MTKPFSKKTFISVMTGALAVSASALLVDASMAQPAYSPMLPPMMDSARMDQFVEMRVEHMTKSLSATPEQKAKLLAIAKAAQADIKPQREQIRLRMDQAMSEAREVLTPEQRAKWDDKLKSRREWMGRHMNGRSHGSMGERMKKE
jgi:Spy/CpxP family protein refolding chaperone